MIGKLKFLATLGLAAGLAAGASACGGVTDSRESARDKATKATCDRYNTCGLIGTDTGMVDGTDAAEFLRPGGCRFALVEARHERAFRI